MKRNLLLAGALALALGSCTSAQEQGLETAIQAACIGLPVGASIVVEIASSNSSWSDLQNAANAAGSDITSVCSTLLTGTENVINEINSGGGTATVSVSTGSAAAVDAMKGLAMQYGVALSVKKVGATKVMQFVVPPPKKFLGIF